MYRYIFNPSLCQLSKTNLGVQAIPNGVVLLQQSNTNQIVSAETIDAAKHSLAGRVAALVGAHVERRLGQGDGVGLRAAADGEANVCGNGVNNIAWRSPVSATAGDPGDLGRDAGVDVADGAVARSSTRSPSVENGGASEVGLVGLSVNANSIQRRDKL